MKTILSILSVLLILCSCEKKNPVSSSGSDSTLKIVFSSSRDFNGSVHVEMGERSEIYTMNTDGSNQKQLTKHRLWSSHPQFTPDGLKIIYVVYHDWTLFGKLGRLARMDVDGGNQSFLTNEVTGYLRFCISPDGQHIVYESESTLWQMDISGNNKKALLEWPDDLENSGQDFPVQFSSDGEWLLFTSYREGDYDIYSVNRDGTNIQNLTQNVWYDFDCVISSDDSKIIFSSYQNAQTHLFIMNADGSNPHQLTELGSWNTFPSCSPDGQKIVFISNRSGYDEIYLMNTDGSDQRCITNINAFAQFPEFSPDCSEILFEVHKNNQTQIYLINLDGSDEIKFTKDGSNFSPQFQPQQ